MANIPTGDNLGALDAPNVQKISAPPQVSTSNEAREIDRLKIAATPPPEVEKLEGWEYHAPELMGCGVDSSEIRRGLVGGLIIEGELHALGGAEGTGKSALSIYLARVIAGLDRSLFGVDDLRNEAGPRSVAIIEDEMGKNVLEQRHSSLIRGNWLHYETNQGIPGGYEGMTPAEALAAVTSKQKKRASMMDRARYTAIVRGVQVLIIDNLSSMVIDPGRREIFELLEEIREMQKAAEEVHQHKLTVILLAHHKKTKIEGRVENGDIYGDSAFIQKFGGIVGLGRSNLPNAFYLKKTKGGRTGPGAYLGGTKGEVLVIERFSAPSDYGDHDEYHLRAVPGVHFEDQVRERANATIDERGGAKGWQETAEIADAYTKRKRVHEPDFEMTPSRLQYALKKAKEEDGPNSRIRVSSTRTLANHWEDITGLMEQNPKP
jgi:archaellum biogenesis ATPase FlaH